MKIELEPMTKEHKSYSNMPLWILTVSLGTIFAIMIAIACWRIAEYSQYVKNSIV